MKTRSALAQATIDRIVDVTIAAIEAGGEPSLRVNDIARDSDVSVATLYHYFGDREGLVVAARLKQYAGSTGLHFDEFAKAAGATSSAAEFAALVRMFFERSISDSSRSIRFLRAEIIGSSRTRPLLAESLRTIQADHVERLAEVFQRARDLGFTTSKIAPHDIAEFALVLHVGSVLPDLIAGEGQSSTSLSRVIAEILDSILITHP
jgi:AcrR family transcriptional regulator